MNTALAESLVSKHPRWYHRYEIFPGVMTPGVYDPSHLLNSLKLPDDMTGLTALDIGAADGFFTKALSARGADVTALDYDDKGFYGFAIMEQLAGRPFRYIRSNVYDLETHGLQPFDYVLCLGVLYHLPDMMRALWLIRKYVKRHFLLETLISRRDETRPMAEYLPGSSLNGDYTNFWAPNVLCVSGMLSDAGFGVIDTSVGSERATFRCVRLDEPDADKKTRVAYSFLEV